MSFEDCSSHILLDKTASQISTNKGFRMARANVGVREGRWYWECKITSGIAGDARRSALTADKDAATSDATKALEATGHVRMGWARREACLDAPIGFDAYSYGLRDVAGQKVHMSRPVDFFPPDVSIVEGDVIGLEINLPSLALHQKIIDGDNYNPAVDIEDPSQPISPASHAPNIVRDRIPIPYKSNMYFEQFEYAPTKELEDLCHPTSSTAAATSPSPTHSNPILRTLPNSHIRIYKNGDLMGEPYTSLLAFLPPASKPQAQPGAREGLDDGHLGYYPAVSVFRGGAAEVNFGPNFWRPPRDVVFSSNPNDHETEEDIEMTDAAESSTKLPLPPPAQPVSQRYAEQIAEDTVYDLIDEVELWLQKGGYMADSEPARERSTAVNSGRLGSEDAPGAQIRQAMGSELELVQSGVSNGLQERMS
jgi:COMPASS component BRE2